MCLRSSQLQPLPQLSESHLVVKLLNTFLNARSLSLNVKSISWGISFNPGVCVEDVSVLAAVCWKKGSHWTLLWERKGEKSLTLSQWEPSLPLLWWRKICIPLQAPFSVFLQPERHSESKTELGACRLPPGTTSSQSGEGAVTTGIPGASVTEVDVSLWGGGFNSLMFKFKTDLQGRIITVITQTICQGLYIKNWLEKLIFRFQPSMITLRKNISFRIHIKKHYLIICLKPQKELFLLLGK